MKRLLLFGLCLLCGCTSTAEPTGETVSASVNAPITITVRVVGDVMLHEAQQLSALTADGGYDFSEYFTAVAADLCCADLTVGNLETPVTGNAPAGYPRFNAPPELLNELQQSGFDCLTLANNHILDQGRDGLSATTAQIEAAGLSFFGVSAQESAPSSLIINVNGIRLGLISHTYGTNGQKDKRVSYLDENRVAAEISYCKEQGADLILAFPHWGKEYYEGIPSSSARWAQVLADCGADVILGSHPHVVQPFALLTAADGRTVPVLYSLGNFVSNQQEAPRFLGLIAELVITRHPSGQTTLDAMGYLPTFVYKHEGKAKYAYEVLPLRQAQTDDRLNSTARKKVQQAAEYLDSLCFPSFFCEFSPISSHSIA